MSINQQRIFPTLLNQYKAGGAQLRNFIKGQGDQKDRKGKGDFVAGDYWQVDFQNLDQQ